MVILITLLLLQSGYAEAEAKILATAEKAESAKAKVEAGDAYSKLALRYPRNRSEALIGMATWYEKAWTSVDGAEKDKLRPRLYLAAGVGDWKKRGVTRPRTLGWQPLQEIEGAGLETGFARTGKCSVRMTFPKGNPNNEGVYNSESIAAKPGTVCKISAFVWSAETDGEAFLHLRYFAADGKLLGGNGPVIEKDSPFWKQVEAEITVPEGAARIGLAYINRSVTGAFWVDDCSLIVNGKELLNNPGFEIR